MFVRIASALVLIPLLLFCVQTGHLALLFFLLAISLASLFELFRVFETGGYKLIKITVYVVTVLTYILIYYKHGLLFHLTPILIVIGTAYAIRGKLSSEELALSVMAYLYIPISLSYIYSLRMQQGNYVWLVFLLAYITDTFAYFVGRAFGKHKLIPSVSPKKTVEGAVGGVVGAVLCCLLFEKCFGEDSHYVGIVILALLGSVASQLGDLFASTMKRHFKVKDYGKLIPGHGGVLDRVDSVLFTAPLTYYAFFLIRLIQELL